MTTDQRLVEHLAASDPGGAATGERLHAGLVAGAGRAGLLDVAYRTLDTPIGPLLLAATPEGVVRIAFGSERHDAVLAELAARVSPRILRAPARLDDVAGQLDEYFAGTRRHFDVAVDLRLVSPFRRTVLEHLCGVAYGSTVSYAALAAASGSPAAVRAVGSACSTNPVPVVVPCHRVIRSDGTLGGYLGGLDVKRALLALEAA